jgi:crossover junction endodeoxyribonuclease RusA
MSSTSPITLTLPYPVSANRYWRSFVPRGHQRAIVTLSDEARAYKETVNLKAWQQGVRAPIEGRVQVHIELYPKRPLDWAKRARKDPAGWDDTVQCIDLDNARKVLYDALKDVAFGDDKWVLKDSAERMEPDEHGARVVVTITAMGKRAAPQASLIEDAA